MPSRIERPSMESGQEFEYTREILQKSAVLAMTSHIVDLRNNGFDVTFPAYFLDIDLLIGGDESNVITFHVEPFAADLNREVRVVAPEDEAGYFIQATASRHEHAAGLNRVLRAQYTSERFEALLSDQQFAEEIGKAHNIVRAWRVEDLQIAEESQL